MKKRILYILALTLTITLTTIQVGAGGSDKLSPKPAAVHDQAGVGMPGTNFVGAASPLSSSFLTFASLGYLSMVDSNYPKSQSKGMRATDRTSSELLRHAPPRSGPSLTLGPIPARPTGAPTGEPRPTGTPTGEPDTKLWYTHPAQTWTEALPIGNGNLGAMIFGEVRDDRLQLNLSTWWTGRPRSYQRPDAHLYLDTIRQLLFQGKQPEAEALAQQHFMGKKDPDENEYETLRSNWLKEVRSDTSYA